jgi:hypothetical protein
MAVRSPWICRPGRRSAGSHVQFVGDDGGQRGLAQAGRAEEQHVVQRLAAGFGGFQGDGQLLFGFGLADELAQPAGAQFQLKALLFVGARGADQPGIYSGFVYPAQGFKSLVVDAD